MQLISVRILSYVTISNLSNVTLFGICREFLVRVLYVEMLGHDGSFGYIKAVVSCIYINILYPSIKLNDDHNEIYQDLF